MGGDSSVEVTAQSEPDRRIGELGAGPGVGNLFDEELSLGVLGPTEELRAPVLADHG
jgi:hypothetical protein